MLQQKNYVFKTDSDTEVIVAAFHEWKQLCLQQFDGMFAFAIWDEQEKKLFAARDRFGEKPFFFYYDNEQFCFASEMRSLWSMGINKQVNASMLYNFLTISYTGNPSDPGETFYENIQKLPAANSGNLAASLFLKENDSSTPSVFAYSSSLLDFSFLFLYNSCQYHL